MAEQTIKLEFNDGSESEVTIRTLQPAMFKQARRFFGSNHDELRLLDLAFNQPEGWSRKLTAESYEAAYKAFEEHSKAFFGYASREEALRSISARITS